MEISYLSAIAGSGKTKALLEHAVSMVAKGKRVIICQPTVLLIEKTKSYLDSLYPDIISSTIHNKNSSPGMVLSLINQFFQSEQRPQIFFITWASFEKLGKLPNSEEWDLLIDEIPNIHMHYAIRVPKTHRILTKYIKHSQKKNSRYSTLDVKNHHRLSEIAKNKEDDIILDIFSGVAKYILSPSWSVYVLTDQYQKLLDGKGQRLDALCMLNEDIFSKFESVIIASACFEDSVFYHWFKMQGIKFNPIHQDELSCKHENGEHLTILYSFDGAFTKGIRDKAEVWPQIVNIVLEEFSGQKTLISANNDADMLCFYGKQNFIQLPNSPHGLNEFIDVDNVVCLGAFNLKPMHYKFLQSMADISNNDIVNATHRQTVYQTLLRSSLRDPTNKNDKKVYVPDKEMAIWIQELFEGSVIKKIGIECGEIRTAGRPRIHKEIVEKKMIGRPRIHADDAARQRAWRERQKAKG